MPYYTEPDSNNAAHAESLPSAVLARAQGCLLGQLVGDALGSMVEFKSAREIQARYPGGLRVIGPSEVHHTIAGQATDDSELALALARSLVSIGAFDEEDVARAYADWLESKPFDVGNTIRRAAGAMLKARSQHFPLAAAGRSAASRSSEANGAMMRQSPLAIWGWRLDENVLGALVRADTTLTHPNQVCQDASTALFVALAATIREGLSGPEAYGRACAWDQAHGSSLTVTAALSAAASTPPAFETNAGHVLVALQNAFYQALHAPSFEAGLVHTVMSGGDPDTNAAIAGALLGAIHGLDAVPEQWRNAVLHCRPAQGVPGVLNPRPELYWPVDALELAENLLRSGAAVYADGKGSGRSGADTIGERHVPLDRIRDAGVITDYIGDRERRETMLDKQPVPDTVADHSNLRSRFRGALVAGAMGDALGRPAEARRDPVYAPPWRYTDYSPWHGYKHGPIGTITDDTQHTIIVAECLLDRGWLDPGDLARRLVEWLPIGRGKGRATTEAVTRLAAGIPWYLAGEDSAGNGAAMRAAPIGLLRFRDPDRRSAEATLSSLPTHRNTVAAAGAVAMAEAVAWLLAQQPGAWMVEDFIHAIQAAIATMEQEPVLTRGRPPVLVTLHDRIGEIPGLLTQQPAKALSYLYQGAFVLESLPAALYCFLRTPNDVEQMLLQAVNGEYDADTVAAMAGTLGGALGGEAALPTRLLGELEYRERLLELADGLYRQAVLSEGAHV